MYYIDFFFLWLYMYKCALALYQLLVFQLLAQAYDNGYPALYDTTVVTINVNRNLQPPVFNQQTYNITILESQTLGETITTVVASDPDSLVSRLILEFPFQRNSLIHA